MLGMLRTLIVAGVVLLAPAEASPQAMADTALARADSLVAAWVSSGRIPGAVLLVVRDGQVMREKAYGHAQLFEFAEGEYGASEAGESRPRALRRPTDPVRMTPTTLFDLASVTKVMATTYAVMLLADRGALDVDAPVWRYLPDFRGGGKDAVTLRHLLTHMAGLQQWVPTYYHASDADGAYAYVRDLPLGWPVGEGRHYSDLGFMVLGRVVEQVAGKPLDAFLRDELYGPLGLVDTGFRRRGPGDDATGGAAGPFAATSHGNPYEHRMVHDTAFGYLIRGDADAWDGWRRYTLVGEVNDANAWHGWGGVAGHAGLFSTARDLSVLLQLLLDRGERDGRRWLSPGTVDAFLTPVVPGQALGWQVPAYAPAGSFAHTGFTGTWVLGVPSRRLAVVLLTNRQNAGVDPRGLYQDVGPLQRAVAAALLDGAGEGAPPPAPPSSDAGTAPASGTRSLPAARVLGRDAPTLDGRLDEAAWATARPATDFVQYEPAPGRPASQRTEARVLVTDDVLYVGMRLWDDQADSIRAQFVRRDDHEALSDWASVMLDSYADRRTAFEFATTPTGTRVDILRLEDVRMDVTWDAVWDVATSRDAQGWTAEFRIPLSQLRFSDDDGGVWGVNFSRRIARRSELAHWAPIPPTSGKHVSLYGDLAGLEGLSAPGRTELLPYVAGRLRRAPGDPANPFWRANDTWRGMGLDVKHGLTSNFTLTATVNPDFGQVEADPSLVNLTAFETFYEEKRPFFTEGTEIIGFRLMPEGYAFYSRRIGRPPQLPVDVPDGGFADLPEATPILGAVKVSGKTADGWSLGLMEAVTGQVDVDVSGPDGMGAQPVEPMTNYAAARVRRDFGGGWNALGLFATAVNRRQNEPAFEGLRSDSYFGAFDWRLRFGPDHNYEFAGWMAGSHARGTPEAMARTQRASNHLFQRPDAPHLTFDPTLTSMSGWAGEWGLRRRGGSKLYWTFDWGARSPGFEVSDLGYITLVDWWYGTLVTRWSDFEADEHVTNWWWETQVVQAGSFGGEHFRRSLHMKSRVTFLNFWQLTVHADRWFRHRWPWELRGGPALRRSPYTSTRWFLRTDTRKPWGVTFQATAAFDDQAGGRELTFDPIASFRPTPRATISAGLVASHKRDPDQYVAQVQSTDGPAWVVGRVAQTTWATQARIGYGFSPTLNLDVYAQPFLSRGRFGTFRTVGDPQADDFERRLPRIPAGSLALDPAADRYATLAFSFRNPDFDVREFRMNAVLRWEYRPGSTLFVVWTQARGDYARMLATDLGSGLDRLFASPATNVLMVKLNYWLGM